MTIHSLLSAEDFVARAYLYLRQFQSHSDTRPVNPTMNPLSMSQPDE